MLFYVIISLFIEGFQFIFSHSRWTFNPAVLSKIRDLPSLDSNSAMVRSLASMSLDESRQRPSRRRAVCSGLFVEGDVVQILNSHYRDRVKTLQEGHGEWTDAMDEVKILFFIYLFFPLSISF